MSKIRVDEIVDIVDEGSPDLPHGATSVEPVAAAQAATKSYVDNSLNGTWSNSVTNTAPTNPAIGSFWVDTSGTLNVLKCWNGSAWEEFSGMTGGIAYEMGIAAPTLVSPTNYSGYPETPYSPSSSEITSAVVVGGSTTSAPLPISNQWQDMTYGGGKFVAVSEVGTVLNDYGLVFTGQQVMWSTDGLSWVAADQTETAEWKGIAYGNGKYVAVSAGPSGQNDTVGNTRVMWSTDAITWNAASAVSTTIDVNYHPYTAQREMKWADIAYGEPNGQPTFVAVAYIGLGNRFMYSHDGINWTGSGLAPGQPNPSNSADNPDGEYDSIRWNGVAYGDGKFVAIASESSSVRCKYSTDGIIWYDGANGLPYRNFQSITYGEPNGQSMWVVVAEKTSTEVGCAYYSYDGINWVEATGVDSNGWVKVTYGEPNGTPRFMAVADHVSSPESDFTAMSSPDGINWTAFRGPANITSSWNSMSFRALSYGDAKFVTIADWSGSSYDTNIIGYSFDGDSWRDAGVTLTFANDSVFMADGGDLVRNETLSTILSGNETLQDLDSLTTGTVTASGTLTPGMSGTTLALTNVTGSWAPGMKIRSLRTLSQVNDEAVKSYDPGLLGSIPAVIPNAGAVSGWGNAEWNVAEDSAFTTNLQTAKANITQGQLQNGPSDLVLEPNKDYFMRIKYSSLDPAISFSEFSKTYTFKTETVTFPDPSVTTTHSTGDVYDLQPRFNCYGGGCSQTGPDWWSNPDGNLVVTNNMYSIAPGGNPGYHMAAFKPVEVTSSLRVWVNTGGSGVAVNAVTWEGVATPEDVLSWPDLNNEFGVPGWVTLPVPLPFTLHSVGRDQQMADTYRGWFRLGAIEVDGHILVEGGVIPGSGPTYTYSDGRWLGSI